MDTLLGNLRKILGSRQERKERAKREEPRKHWASSSLALTERPVKGDLTPINAALAVAEFPLGWVLVGIVTAADRRLNSEEAEESSERGKKRPLLALPVKDR
ncbi:uncharacterized protein N7482_009212 [Penicillium canariense]|uniref:Uncharacterized protein n=1 Tax=Penicillium canariense TaxID=189055 RepID=A0A9W9HPY5_9EURO|nr:uncharacterized protein N7482_009212 [Penicillium canariense]KAJ5152734.1 hypothetical protein N7482_009212 [Penicillium canariense]